MGISRLIRNIPPSQQELPFSLDGTLHLLFTRQPGGMLFGQKNHADPVFAGRWQFNTQFGHFLAVKGIGDLDQNARPIPHQLVSSYRATVVEILQNLQSAANDVMGLDTLDMGHEANAAGIVLKTRVVLDHVQQDKNVSCASTRTVSNEV